MFGINGLLRLMRATSICLTLWVGQSVGQSSCVPTTDTALNSLQLMTTQEFSTNNIFPHSASFIEADFLSGVMGKNHNAGDSWEAQGAVRLWHYPYRLSTELLLGDSTLNTIQLPLPFRVESPHITLSLQSGEFKPNTGQLQGYQGEFIARRAEDVNLPFRGSMDSITSPNATIKAWENVLLTTCPLNDRDWDLTSHTLITDEETNIGTMSHAVLRMGGIPIFYWPWMDFPLQGQRKSGFLFPIIRQRQDNQISGTNIAFPYYINLAPNYDWLFTPYRFEKRGIRLDNEVRYLFPTAQGSATINVMQRDEINARTGLEPRRSRYIWQHQQKITDSMFVNILWNKVSDPQYLKDFSDDPLYPASTVNLPLSLQINDVYNQWRWSAAFLDYQNLSNNPDLNKPYQRRPLITFSSPRYRPFFDSTKTQDESWEKHLILSAQGEYSKFSHDYLPNIERTFFYPKWEWQNNDLSGFFHAQLGVHASKYRRESMVTSAEDNNLSRIVPITKASVGLNFERPVFRDSAGEIKKDSPYVQPKDWVQTLEPALYWLYIPYRRQNQFPVLDTSRPGFQLGQLDVDNNFSGWDRIADTHQLTFGLTSKILNDQRQERLTLSAGQRLFLQEQEVLLPGESVQKAGRGDFVMNVRWRDDHWKSEAQWRYDPQIKATGTAETLIAYQSSSNNLIGLRHTFQRQPVLPTITALSPTITKVVNLQKTVEGILDVDLGKGWRASGRNYYSLYENIYLETHMALRYQTCCMAVTLTRSNELLSADRSYRTQWGIQFSFLGFTQLGKKSDASLDNAFRSFRVR